MSGTKKRSTLDEILLVENIPSLPTIFIQINEAVDNPRSSMREIAEIISADQSLTARLLRLVNSAFYGFPSKIETISHAVTIIGTQQLRDLALATTVIQLFRDIPAELIQVNSFWRHCLACGFGARVLASYHRESNIERFFVAGLLHDIGRLLIYKRNAEQAKETLLRCGQAQQLLFRMEREVMGFDHADVGGLLLSRWRLPRSLEEAVRFHHRPGLAAYFPLEASITHLGDLIANALQLGTSGERYVPPLDERAWTGLSFSPSILPPAIKQLDQQFTATVDFFLEDIPQ